MADPSLPVIARLGVDDWRLWRQVRLAALADAPGSFGSSLEAEAALGADDWRTMVRDAALFVAIADGTPVGVVAGISPRSGPERRLGAMWVRPDWRGSGVAAALAGAVIGWARAEGAGSLGLWVPTDQARARRFYQRQGFEATGRTRLFPHQAGRSISELILSLG